MTLGLRVYASLGVNGRWTDLISLVNKSFILAWGMGKGDVLV